MNKVKSRTARQESIKAYLQDTRRHPYQVSVFVRHPHFHDTGFDSECIEAYRTMWGNSPSEMIEYARKTLVPPHYDPALVSIVVEALDSNVRAEG